MATNGIVEIAGSHSVDETVENLKNILEAKGVMLFAFVDHSGEAIKAGFNAAHQAAHLRQPEGRNSPDAGLAHRGARSAAQDSGARG